MALTHPECRDSNPSGYSTLDFLLRQEPDQEEDEEEDESNGKDKDDDEDDDNGDGYSE